MIAAWVAFALTTVRADEPSGHAGGAASASAAPVAKGAEVKLHDTLVFRLWVDHPPQTLAVRARAAGRALEQALEASGKQVRVDAHGDARVVFVDDTPIVELYAADAEAAGRASLDVYAANVATQVRVVLSAEQKRSDIARAVFSLSLVVFFGLIALYVLRKIGELTQRARDSITEHPERIGPIRLNRIELIGAAPLRALLLAAVMAGRWVLQFGVAYVWLVLSLSRFEATRGFTAHLTSSLLEPLTSLAQRALGALPILVLGAALIGLVFVLLRFAELFFAGVSRGHERALWLAPDLVSATSALVRIGIVLLALIFAGPIVSGDPDSVFAHVGNGVLLGVALALSPLLASVALGTVIVFTRRLRIGRQVELGGHAGRIVSINLFDVLLREASGAEVRVPHLRTLVSPTRVQAPDPRLSLELRVSPAAAPSEVLNLLVSSARAFTGDDDVLVELSDIDAECARYQVSVKGSPERRASQLRIALVEALMQAQIGFGKGGPPRG
jgi:small conductance mechanosensitive channel